MILAILRDSIYLLELSHFKIISQKEAEITLPSDFYLDQLNAVISSVNYKADLLQLDLLQIAAEYFVRICCGHKLPDGNKRMAVAALGYFLDFNGYKCHLTNDKLRNYAIILAHEATSYIPIDFKILKIKEVLIESCTKVS